MVIYLGCKKLFFTFKSRDVRMTGSPSISYLNFLSNISLKINMSFPTCVYMYPGIPLDLGHVYRQMLFTNIRIIRRPIPSIVSFMADNQTNCQRVSFTAASSPPPWPFRPQSIGGFPCAERSLHCVARGLLRGDPAGEGRGGKGQ